MSQKRIMRHDTKKNIEACHTNEMSRVTHLNNESCHTYECVVMCDMTLSRVNTHTHTHSSTRDSFMCESCHKYGVAIVSRTDSIIGLFGRILSLS